MKLYEVIVMNVFGTDISHFVVAKNEDNAKKMVLDYYSAHDDGIRPTVTMYDLAVSGPIEPENYADEVMLA
ncbi:hypothetical protein FOD75_03165 [Limosilactobacillus reuteri]|uniref:Uncharacterized protein n=1 Tax=Limosilactobacillus reuteri TaxID=1598 RepID=A0A517D496_LIMRT|nr:hypothetical protein [Limosilactobacillus reuteri]QDR72159.1 hypothetical protein FOD75_03165 [Limosilactobacillus reuteri]